MSKKDIQLYYYQQNLIDEIEGEISFNDAEGDYFIDSPVSSGKSFMISALAEMLQNQNRVVILISITSLLEQIAEHLDIVGCDYSILKAGYDNHFFPEKRIQLVMAQTFHARLESIDIEAKYIIQDEGHREFNTDRTNAIMRKLKAKTRFLFSGTCYDSQGFQFNGSNKTFTTIGMPQLIDEGKLSHVKYFVPKWANDIDYDNVKTTAGEYNTASLEEIINSSGHLLKILESMNYMKAKSKKTLVFCSSIDQCELITQMLQSNGYLAESVHSKVNKKDQENIIEAFRNNSTFVRNSDEQNSTLFTDAQGNHRLVKCLVSVNKLGIGFSVEDIDLGVGIRPTKIRALAVQIAGRIYRSHPSKQFGEFLDLAQLTKNFGFPHEEYLAPVRTGNKLIDDKTLLEATKPLAMPKLELILCDYPTEITRDQYNFAIEKMLEQERMFKANREAHRQATIDAAREKSRQNNVPVDSNMAYAQELVSIINTTDDIYSLIAAGAEFWTILNGRPISKAGKPYSFSIDWLAENAIAAFETYPLKHKHWLKSYRTRIKNVCKSAGNYNGIKFFIDFLVQKHLEELELDSEINIYENRVSMPAITFTTIDIDPDEIPF